MSVKIKIKSITLHDAELNFSKIDEAKAVMEMCLPFIQGILHGYEGAAEGSDEGADGIEEDRDDAGDDVDPAADAPGPVLNASAGNISCKGNKPL